MKKKFALATGVALLAMAFASPALADRIVVDNDGVQCPNPDSFTIQGGVFLAGPGDTVFVCAGTYNEEVLISGPLKNDIRVVGADVDEVIVDGNNTMMHGFHLENVSGVELKRFTVQRYHDNIVLVNADGNTIRKNVTTATWDHDGIQLNTSDGNRIEHNVAFATHAPAGCGINLIGSNDNVVRHNLVYANPNAGIQVQGSGAGNEVTHNVARNNVGGAAPNANGIRNANAPGTLIAHNLVRENGHNGIRVTGAGSADVRVEHNDVLLNGTADDDGIRLDSGVSGSTVAHNHAEGHDNSGIRLLNAGTGNVIAHNDVSDNGLNGVLNDSTIGTLIEHNKANRNVGFGAEFGRGIHTRNSADLTIRHNDANRNTGDGIVLGTVQDSEVLENHADRNGRDGIRSGSNSSGNNFVRNHMRHNGQFDADDMNRPANTWTDNHCDTDNPPGTIC